MGVRITPLAECNIQMLKANRFYGGIIPSLFNIFSLQGYLVLNAIIGGQLLASVSSHLNDTLGIVIISVISLANPWLDWLEDDAQAVQEATKINDELVQWCTTPEAAGRLYGFGVLPTSTVSGCVAEIRRLSSTPELRKYIKGVIIGTLGAGKGLDDEALDPMWKALEESGLMAFVHPHA